MSKTPVWLKVSTFGLFTLAMGWAYLDSKMKKAVIEAPVVKDSIRLLENYPQADKYLGKPIFVKPMNTSHPFNEFKDDSVKFALSVRGKNHSGELYSWCSKLMETTDETKGEAENWQVDRLDLNLDTKQRLTFYRRPGAPVEE